MFARFLLDLTKGRLRLPLLTATPTTPGDVRLSAARPFVTTNEATPRQARLLTDLEMNTPGNPPALGEDGLLPASVIPPSSTPGGDTAGMLLGEIRMWAGFPLRVPSGWLVCDGSELLISANPELFGVIGHLYGRSSDPTTRFKLPNFVGRSPAGCVGPNDAAQGAVWKVNVRNRGVGYTPSAVYTGLSLVADGSTLITTPATVTVTIGADGGVDRVDVVTGGAVTNLASSANPTTDPSNCTLRIPSLGGAGFGFTYDILLAPTTGANTPWGARLSNRGAGYVSDPEVVITGPTLRGATARAVREGDQIREIVITNAGVGDPAGATVSLNGGGWTTQATATVVLFSSPTVPGDIGGEQQHRMLMPEMPAHSHPRSDGGSPAIYYPSGPSGRGSDSDIQPGTTPTNGDDRPMNLRDPYLGVLFIIRAS